MEQCSNSTQNSPEFTCILGFKIPTDILHHENTSIIYVGPFYRTAVDFGTMFYTRKCLLLDSKSMTPFEINVLRDLSRRNAISESAATFNRFGILVENPSDDLHITLANFLQDLCIANGILSNIIYVGRLTATKLGNFTDVQAFVHISCYGRERFEFHIPVLSPFEFLCSKFGVDFWTQQFLRDYFLLCSHIENHLLPSRSDFAPSHDPDGERRQMILRDTYQMVEMISSSRSGFSYSGLKINTENRPMGLEDGSFGNSAGYDHEATYKNK